jgi:hypothetical protein
MSALDTALHFALVALILFAAAAFVGVLLAWRARS